MNRIKRITTGLLAVLLAAQCASAALAARPAGSAALQLLPETAAHTSKETPGSRWYTVVYDERDAQGNLVRPYRFDSEGNRIPLKKSSVYAAAEDEFPASYDARKEGLVTPVKNQDGTANCWAFAAISTAESNYIKQGYGTADNTDFSESHLVWFSQRSRSADFTDSLYGDGKYAQNPYNEGGNFWYSAPSLMSGTGLRLESYAPWFKTLLVKRAYKHMTLPESERYACDVRVIGANVVIGASESTIKHSVLEYGAVGISYYSGNGYNYLTGAFYQNEKTGKTNHEACIVGWDDNYSIQNFKNPKPQHNGAWLVKNSWGKLSRKSGYFWMSYEEPSIYVAATYETAPKSLFDNIYQYDGFFPQTEYACWGETKMANVFTAKKTELLTHAAFYLSEEAEESVSVQVFSGDAEGQDLSDPFGWMQPVSEITVSEDARVGYHTVELASPVTLQPEQMFAIVVTLGHSEDSNVYVPAEYTIDPTMPRASGSSDATSYFSLPMESYIYCDGRWRCAYKEDLDDDDYFEEDEEEDEYSDVPKEVDPNEHVWFNVPIKAMTRDLDETQAEPSLRVESLPKQTEYTVSDRINLDGLKLCYTDASGKKTILNAASCDGLAISDLTVSHNGENVVIVSYKGARTGFTVSGKNGREMQFRRPFPETLWYGETLKLYVDTVNVPEGSRIAWYLHNEDDGFIGPRYGALDEPFVYKARGDSDTEIRITAILLDADNDLLTDNFGWSLNDDATIELKCSKVSKLLLVGHWLMKIIKILFG